MLAITVGGIRTTAAIENILIIVFYAVCFLTWLIPMNKSMIGYRCIFLRITIYQERHGILSDQVNSKTVSEGPYIEPQK
jgi:hypothetical protein